MKQRINKFILILAAIAASITSAQFFYACKSTSLLVKDKQTENAAIDEWKHVLEAGKEDVKKYWVELVDGNWDFFKKSYNTELNTSDIKNLILVPSEVYVIDSVDFATLNSGKSPEKILKLNTGKAIFEVVKDNKFVAAIHAKYVDKKWENGGGYSGIYKIVADKLTSLYFDKHLPYFQVEVNAIPHQHYNYSFLVYIENGEYKCVKMDGKTPLLTDELIELRNYLIQSKNSK